MKAPSGNRRATARANVQGHSYGANNQHGPALDGVLITWGDRLFYPGNRIVQVRPQPRLDAQGSQGSQQRAAAIRQRIEATVVRRAPQVMVKVTGGGRSMAAIAAHFRPSAKTGGWRSKTSAVRRFAAKMACTAWPTSGASVVRAFLKMPDLASGGMPSTSCCRCRAAPPR